MYDLTHLNETLMEGTDVNGVKLKDKKWCVIKYKLLIAITMVGDWAEEVLQGSFFAKLMLALEKRITELGGRVELMQNAYM